MWRTAAGILAFFGVLTQAPAPARAEDPPDLRAAYESNVRHRLPGKLTAVVDASLALHDLRGIGSALPELWRTIRDDPDLQALFANLVEQYKPRLDYAAYVGTVAETTQYVGVAVGVEADLAAPLCRYVGGAFNGHLYEEPRGPGIAWDSRVTGCLPWGPFALELGILSRRDVRVGLAAPPTTGGGRFDALGFEVKVRGFRLLQPGWELVTVPVDVTYLDVAPAVDDGRESVSWVIDAAAVRFVRYGAGAGGRDRVVEVVPVRVAGHQDSLGERMSAYVVGVGALAWQGARLHPALHLDGNAMLQQGVITTTTTAEFDPMVSVFTGAVDVGLHALIAGIHGTARYRRGLLSDDEFRLLAEDRGELSARFRTWSATWGADVFVAYARTVAAPEGTSARAAAGTFGATFDYGRPLYGPMYLAVRAEGARSFYAAAGGPVLDAPKVELRGLVALAASWNTAGK